MRRITIEYGGTFLDLPDFLVNIWPFDLPLDGWPTFCGAGEGFGDWIVPDEIYDVPIRHICFLHDIAWAITEPNFGAAMQANWDMYQRVRRTVLANYDDKRYSEKRVEVRCLAYLLGTIVGVRRNFKPDGTYQDPFASPTVRARLRKLATVHDINPELYEMV